MVTLEAILERNNLNRAYKQVKANRGGPGVDGMTVDEFLDYLRAHAVERECQDFCVWGGYSRGSPTRLPFVFEMQYARPDAIAGAKVEGPARSAGGSSLAPAIARREAAGALAREV